MRFLELWVLLAAWLATGGWVLSWFGALNAAGYGAWLVAGAVAWRFWRRARGGEHPNRPVAVRGRSWGRWLRRFRRPLPLGFGVLAALALLGGLIHAPSNYDALAYRVPRVLHWLAEGRWHWIATDYPRVNTRGCGIEWVSAPLLAWLRSDRPLFLLNEISFLLLPGLVFGVLRRLGVPGRVAAHWMWLLPTGYCYLLQAGSIGNDLFGTPFALAAILFALRARRNGSAAEAWLSVLAAALATGVKSSNLLLGLPWLVAIWPARKRLFSMRWAVAPLGCLALLASFVPMAALNLRHGGDWSGQALEQAAMGGAPAVRVAVNAFWLTLRNFTPPMLPVAGAWNAAVQRALPSEWKAWLETRFEPGEAGFRLPEMESEENAALGLGVCALLLWSGLAAPRGKRTRVSFGPVAVRRRAGGPVIGMAWVALALFLSQSGLSAITRLLAPYYVLLAAAWLRAEGHRDVVMTRWWRGGALAVFGLGAMLLVLNPARPLWPANTVLRALGAEHSTHPLLRRAWTVYSVYAVRPRAFEPVLKLLPPDAKRVGFIGFDDPETSLWRPFGSRAVVHVRRAETAARLREMGIRYVVAGEETFRLRFGETLAELQARLEAEVIHRLELPLRAGRGPVPWYVLRVRSDPELADRAPR